MKPFTKLFASIISSSIWRAPKETKVVWITMLAMSDKDGEVWASVGGMADMARVTKEECRKALDELLAPDDDSRTKEHEGRRIEEIEGGWRILNYKKYRELGRGEDRREYFAEQKREKRAEQKSTMSTLCPHMSPIAEAEAEAEAEKRERAPATRLKDEWKYVKNEPWARALQAAGCLGFPKDWLAWQGVVDRCGGFDSVANAAQSLPPSKRYHDQVEAASIKPAARIFSPELAALCDELSRKEPNAD